MIYKRMVFAAFTVALTVGFLANEANAQRTFRAISTQDQEVQDPPPVDTGAFGFSTYRFFGFGNFEVLFSSRVSFGLSGPLNPVAFDSGAHLHLAPFGENGPIVLVFDNDPDIDLGFAQISFDFRTRADLLGMLEGQQLKDLRDEIEAGNIYLNEHTILNPAGEIRGQLK